MIKNYIKMAFRNLWKSRGYSALSIFGLAIGITCAALIFLWVEDEVSYNSHFEESELIYSVSKNQKYDGEWRTSNQATPGPLSADLKKTVPGIEFASRSYYSQFLVNINGKSIKKIGRYVDPEYLDIFHLNFLEGNQETALKEIKSIVITRTMADQLFGINKSALNENIKLNNEEEFTITGVVQDVPSNVTYQFECLIPFKNFEIANPFALEYGSNFTTTIVKLSPHANLEKVNKSVRDFAFNTFDKKDLYYSLLALKDWRLRSSFVNGKQAGGRIEYVNLFTFIALCILLLASINFMNLATARSEKRANEVGVRKALGSNKASLIIQFLSEALMTTVIAGLLSIALIAILLPRFNILIGKQLDIGWNDPLHIASLLVIIVSLGIMAGIYPAFYLSSFKPVEVLTGIKTSKSSASYIRKGLVIGQFALSIVFIICTLTVYEQVQHVKGRELGFSKDNLIQIPVNGDLIKNFEPIEQELTTSNNIESVALSNSTILDGGFNGSGLTWQGGIDTKDILISSRFVSNKFFKTAGIKLKEGRLFSNDIVKDTASTVISSSFARLMGEGSAIGKTINRYGYNLTVIGVTENYLYDDMYGTSDPVLFYHNYNQSRFLYARVNPEADLTTSIATIKETLNKYNPAFPLEYSFVDAEFNARFQSENLMGKLSQIFALLAVLISCLGLFGLSAYTTERRKKEIGIRKVLGSKVYNIVKLLSVDFIKLVLIAIMIAMPVGYFLMNNWLQDYAYRIDFNYWVLLIAAVMAVTIALLTVSFQAIKAAIANPVHSLRTE